MNLASWLKAGGGDDRPQVPWEERGHVVARVRRGGSNGDVIDFAAFCRARSAGLAFDLATYRSLAAAHAGKLWATLAPRLLVIGILKRHAEAGGTRRGAILRTALAASAASP